jgi:hypothetical protein
LWLPSVKAYENRSFIIQLIGHETGPDDFYSNIKYSYSTILSVTDTVYIDPISINEHSTFNKENYTVKLSVVNSSNNLVFVINCGNVRAGPEAITDHKHQRKKE